MDKLHNFEFPRGILIAFLLISMIIPVFAQKLAIQERPKVDKSQVQTIGPLKILTSVKNDLSLPLSELVKNYVSPVHTREQKVFPLRPYPFEGLIREMPFVLDPSLQDWQGANRSATVLLSFDGLEIADNTSLYGAPSDQNGDVGPHHYIQIVNAAYEIFDKAGNNVFGPFDNNTLWVGFGGPCENYNNGDPIVLYDQLADRWFLSQFAVDNPGNQSICVACSQTSDPTGAYYRYQFNFNTNFPDYPKFGVWGDAYTATYRIFPNSGGFDERAGALERDAMLAGNPAQMVVFSISNLITDAVADGFLPADLDGPAPPAGTPFPVLGHQDDGSTGAPNDRLAVFELTPDWNNTANSTFSGPVLLATNPYDAVFAANIPQPGTAQTLDILPYFTMFSLQTRDFGSHMSIVTNHTVNVGTNHAGIRWYELRNSGSGWSIFQQGTYAPDNDNRWMGSIAMDGKGDIALGYSLSSSTTFPAIRFTGHTAGAPPGVMDVPEESIFEGTGSQTSPDRWGDYSMMTVDPSDDSTFWYTNQYYATTSSFNWKTRIGSFNLGPTVPLANIDVSPTSLTFNVLENGTDSDILTISNTALSGAQDLVWDMFDKEVVLTLSDGRKLPVSVSTKATKPKDGKHIKKLEDQKGFIEDFTNFLSTERSIGNVPMTYETQKPKNISNSLELLQNVNLVLDDGSSETSVGLTSGGQFIWLNRFTPDPVNFPFLLNEVQILFGAGVGVNVGDLVDIYIYGDTDGDGDPGTGANLLGAINDAAVQFVDDINFSVYPLDPISINGPGDVIIAVVNRTAGTNAGDHPAALDQTSTQGRSWVGTYQSGNPPNPPTLPADDIWGTIDNIGIPGNWMIRGYGTNDCPWVSENPTSGTIPAGNNQNVDVTVDATGLAVGTYNCDLIINSNDPDESSLTIPVTLNVEPPSQLSVVPSFRDATFASGTTTFDVSNTGGGTMNWTATSNDTWLNISSGSSGTNGGTITTDYTENTELDRIGTIIVAAPGSINSPDTVEVRQEGSAVNMTISSGWNMIGLPLVVNDGYYLNLFPNAIAGTLYGFDASYVSLDTLKLGEGYWLRFPSDEIALIEGYPITSIDIDLTEGWNMLTGISCNVALNNVSDPGGIIIPGTLYGFEGSYILSDTIKQGNGYWIRANADGLITLDCGGAGSAEPSLTPLNTLTESSLEISDLSGASQTLYFNVELNDPAQKLSYSLPPVPPAGSFDARFEDGYRFIEADEGIIQLQSSHYPVKLRFLYPPGDGEYTIEQLAEGEVIESEIIEEGDSIEISNPLVKQLKMSGMKTPVVPAEFVLRQNYPNPFNPKTRIDFGVPDKGGTVPIRIAVYNILGEKVRTLVDGNYEAGFHYTVWNGKNDHDQQLASGVYFLRFESEFFVKTRKMLMLR